MGLGHGCQPLIHGPTSPPGRATSGFSGWVWSLGRPEKSRGCKTAPARRRSGCPRAASPWACQGKYVQPTVSGGCVALAVHAVPASATGLHPTLRIRRMILRRGGHVPAGLGAAPQYHPCQDTTSALFLPQKRRLGIPGRWGICPPHLWVSLSWRSPRTPPGGCPQTGRKTGARPRKRRRWELAHKCACEPKIRTPGGPHTRARDKRRGGPTYVFRFTREDLSFATGALHKCMS